jgi:hypothetical protein
MAFTNKLVAVDGAPATPALGASPQRPHASKKTRRVVEGAICAGPCGVGVGMSTYSQHQRRGGWRRTRWLVLGAVLVAIIVAIVLVVVHSGGGGSGGGLGY